LRAMTLHWDGSVWSAIPNPGNSPGINFELFGVSALPTGEVWAVGDSYGSGNTNTHVMHWGGASWAIVPSQNMTGGSSMEQVAALSATDVWAAGYGFVTGSPFPQTLVERYTNPCNPPTATPTGTSTPTATRTATATLTPTCAPPPSWQRAPTP